MKSLILKIDNNNAYIMNNDGSFIIIPAESNWETGQIIKIRQQHEQLANEKNVKLAASITSCFSIMVSGGLCVWNAPITYVDITVNPNLELTLNQEEKKKKSLATSESYIKLLNLLEKSGYLAKKNAQIKLDVSNNNSTDRDELEALLSDLTNNFIIQNELNCTFGNSAISENSNISASSISDNCSKNHESNKP